MELVVQLQDSLTIILTMKELMNYVTLCIANDEDFESSLGIHAFDGDMAHGIDQIQTYKAGMEEILRQYPGCKAVASVLRNMRTVEDGDWMGIYLKDGKFYESPVHTVHSLEAVGAGDAFASALLVNLTPAWKKAGRVPSRTDIQAAAQNAAGFSAQICLKPGAFGHGQPIPEGYEITIIQNPV